MSITDNWSILVVLTLSLPARFVAASIPDCEYGQTISLNLTDPEDGAYHFQGALIPDDLLGSYDYVPIVGSARRHTSEHMRACICKLKHCIRMCCKVRRFDRTSATHCLPQETDIFFDPRLAIGNSTDVRLVDVTADNEEFFFQPVHLRCTNMYLEPIWELQEDGVLRISGGELLTDDYCFAPILDGDSSEYSLEPFICVAPNPKLEISKLTTYLMIVSAILMTTITVKYALDTNDGGMQHNCEALYVFWLTVAFVLSAFIKAGILYPGIIVGCLLYYSAFSTFAWLSIVSHNLLLELRFTMRCGNEGPLYCVYLLWATVVPMACTLGIVYKYGHMSDNPDCTQNCWSQVYPQEVFYYLYVPGAIMVLYCLCCCSYLICTQYDLPTTPRFGLWARITLFMSALWALDVISFFLTYTGYDDHGIAVTFSNISNIVNANQGIIVFVLFVEQKLRSLWQRKRNDFRPLRQSYEFTEFYPL